MDDFIKRLKRELKDAKYHRQPTVTIYVKDLERLLDPKIKLLEINAIVDEYCNGCRVHTDCSSDVCRTMKQIEAALQASPRDLEDEAINRFIKHRIALGVCPLCGDAEDHRRGCPLAGTISVNEK